MFKVGDKVRMIAPCGRAPFGALAIVTRENHTETYLWGSVEYINVKWSRDYGQCDGGYESRRFELVTEEKKMVDWNKPIEYVSCDEVLPAKVVGFDINGDRLIVGERKNGSIYYDSFDENGRAVLTSEQRYVITAEAFIRNKSRWANIYANTASSYDLTGYVYATREEADRQADLAMRVACVEIP